MKAKKGGHRWLDKKVGNRLAWPSSYQQGQTMLFHQYHAQPRRTPFQSSKRLLPNASGSTDYVAVVSTRHVGGVLGIRARNIWLFRQILPMFTPISPPIRHAQTDATNPVVPLALGTNMVDGRMGAHRGWE